MSELGAPGGEALIEPQVVPPHHGHQVAEPLVRQLLIKEPPKSDKVNQQRGDLPLLGCCSNLV